MSAITVKKPTWKKELAHVVDIPLAEAYRMLLLPSEQEHWNSGVIFMKVRGGQEIKEGAVIDCTFKATGKQTFIVDKIIANSAFTLLCDMQLANTFSIGIYSHQFYFTEINCNTVVTQMLSLQLHGIGKFIRRIVTRQIQRRMHRDMKELQEYHYKQHDRL